MKRTAITFFVASAFVMALAAILPEQSQRLAPKTKIAVPCPGCPVSIQATWVENQQGQRTLILKEVQLPRPMLMASPACKPQLPKPDKPNPAKPNPAAVLAMQIQRKPPCTTACAN